MYDCIYDSYIHILVIQKMYLLAQEKDNLNNFLCSDVQVRGAYPGFAKRYFRDNNIEIKMEEDDEQILKEGLCRFLYI